MCKIHSNICVGNGGLHLAEIANGHWTERQLLMLQPLAEVVLAILPKLNNFYPVACIH